jgi:hypothetical protein
MLLRPGDAQAVSCVINFATNDPDIPCAHRLSIEKPRA